MVTVTLPADVARTLLAAAHGAQVTALDMAGVHAREADYRRAVNPDLCEVEREHRDQASHCVEQAERLYEAIGELTTAIGTFTPVIGLAVVA